MQLIVTLPVFVAFDILQPLDCDCLVESGGQNTEPAMDPEDRSLGTAEQIS